MHYRLKPSSKEGKPPINSKKEISEYSEQAPRKKKLKKKRVNFTENVSSVENYERYYKEEDDYTKRA